MPVIKKLIHSVGVSRNCICLCLINYLLVSTLIPGCTKKQDSHRLQAENEQRDLSPAKEKLIMMQKAAQAEVEIENGEGAVIKVPEGYLFLVPTKETLETGSYELYFSRTGNFAVDKELVEYYHGNVYDLVVRAMGHQVQLGAGSSTSVYLWLSNSNSVAAIAKVPFYDPNMIDVTAIQFKENAKWDNQVLLDFVKEELSNRQP